MPRVLHGGAPSPGNLRASNRSPLTRTEPGCLARRFRWPECYPRPVMLEAPIPADEERRLALLKACHIMYTPAEEAFDDVAQLAADLCGTEIALITLVDAERQWFKA